MSVKVPFVDLKANYLSIKSEVDAGINDVLNKCNFILGNNVADFEKAYAAFIGAKECISVASGLDALILSFRALGLGPDDEVIVPANTFIATSLSVLGAGAKPVLVDCDLNSYNLDVTQIEKAITPRTRAICPVHLTGQSVDMDPVLELARKHKLFIVEDACQAHGTKYKGRTCGTLGDLGCYSFYPGKNLGCYGDGGAIVTNDSALADKLRRLRNYGSVIKYEHTEKGVNSRLDTIQAAILSAKLPHLEKWNQARHRHAQQYRKLLADVKQVTIRPEQPYSTHIYHLFIVEVEDRAALQKSLNDAGVQSGIHYPIPLHMQQAHSDLPYKKGDFPNSEYLASRILSLPMFPELTEEQVSLVCSTIRKHYGC